MPSEAADVDHGQLVGRRLKDVAIVMDLHELAPVGGRAGQSRWLLHRRIVRRRKELRHDALFFLCERTPGFLF